MAVSRTGVPEGYHTVTPYIRVRGAAKAIDFYKAAFGAEELTRMATPDGQTVMHAEVRIGDSVIMLGDESPDMRLPGPQSPGGTTGGLHVYVPDADAAVVRAVRAGAKVTMPAADMFWGDRYAKLLDPFGHEWSVATRKENLTDERIAERAMAFFSQMKQ